MFSRPALIAFGLVVAEYLLVTWAFDTVGVGAVLLGLLLASFVGLVLVRRAGPGFLRASMDTVTESVTGAFGARPTDEPDRRSTDAALADRAVLLVAGVLLAIPGLVTALIGFTLLFPPVRALARPYLLHRIRPWFRTPMTFGPLRRNGRDVVDVDVVNDTDSGHGPSSRRGPAELT